MMRFLRCAAVLGAAGLAAGCADDGLGTLKLALSVEGQVSFELTIYEGAVDAAFVGDDVFSSGCVTRRSTVLELTRLPVSSGYSVLYRAFGAEGCAGAPLAIGFRGGIELSEGDARYVHVPIWETGAGTAMPVDLNLSSLAATPVDACDDPGVCGGGAPASCVVAGEGAFCVPTCTADADCAGLHDEAVCDRAAGWCMLESPWPLNLSEQRAFARAVTRSNGDIIILGGLMPEADGGLATTVFPVERFDAATGVFGPYDLVGFDGRPGAAFGMAQLSPDRVVVAGGTSGAGGFTREGGRVGLDIDWRTQGVDKVFVVDLASGNATSASLGQVVVSPAVQAIDADSFVVVGGRAPEGQGALKEHDGVVVCDIGSDGALSCLPGPALKTPRVAPALVCVRASDDACDQFLVLGGNAQPGADKVAELLDLSGEEIARPPIVAEGLPDVIDHPVLCGVRLVGGATPAGPVASLRLDISGLAEGRLSVVADGGADTTTVSLGGHTADGCGLVAGGFVRTGEGWIGTDAASAASQEAVGEPIGALARVRAAPAVARIGAGPLAGRWLVVGGMEVGGGGARVVKGAEVFSP